MANKNPVNQFGVGNKAAAKPGGPRVQTSVTLSKESHAQLKAVMAELGMNKREALDAAIAYYAKIHLPQSE